MKDQLSGKLKELVGIPNKLIPKLHYNLNELHRKLIDKTYKLNIADELHRIALNLFHNDYFPIISRNINIDENTTAIIMGSIAYNMNIPASMKYLRLNTDDIDIKIFTTEINYLHQDQKSLSKILSVLKFTILIICMYLKQIFNIIYNFHIGKKGKEPFNFLSHYELILQLKIKANKLNTYTTFETIDITKLTYSQLFNKIMQNINDYKILMTNKIIYKTSNTNKLHTIAFSDLNVVYAGLGTPAFFSQYLETEPHALNKSLVKLINMKIPVSKIMNIKTCANNCRFMSIKSLIMDTVIMLSYADLLVYENLDNGGQVLVPAAFIFKFYKYLVKYVRLIVLRKFYENTLNKKFLDAAKSLWQYALNDLRKHSSTLRFGLDERDPIVLTYKNYLNEFHQNLFHNRSFLSNNFPILMEIADEYQQLVFFVNKSRNLFRELNESTETQATSIENIVIQYAEQELSKYSNSSKSSLDSIYGGSNKYEHMDKNKDKTSTKNIILTLDEEKDDNKDEYVYSSSDKANIINKLEKLIKDEVNIYSSIPKTLSKKSKIKTKIMQSSRTHSKRKYHT
jgi:hypothetical protein